MRGGLAMTDTKPDKILRLSGSDHADIELVIMECGLPEKLKGRLIRRLAATIRVARDARRAITTAKGGSP